jgi:hypothetical protein
MVDTNGFDQNQIDEASQTSVEVIALAIGLAYKWQKTDLIKGVETWVQDFTKSMNKDELGEFQNILKGSGLVK